MKKLQLVVSLFFLFSFFLFIQFSFASLDPLNFECGGYVTEVYAPWISSSTLFARTDVGGIYRYQGSSWHYLSGEFKYPNSLMVQGLAFPTHDTNTILLACGDINNDIPGKGLYVSTNYGANWVQTLNINYGGNAFDIKIGGECIAFDKNATPDIYAYTGGINSGVYRSTNTGQTWTQIASNSTVTGNIVSITVETGTIGLIWVGTTDGLWRGVPSSKTVSWTFTKLFSSNIHHVYRVIAKNDTAYVTHKTSNLDSGLVRITNSGSTFTNLSTNFNAGAADTSGNFVSVLLDKNNNLVASRMQYPTRISTNGGTNWSTLNFDLDESYNPKHALVTKSAVFDARNNMGYHPNTGSPSFCSGGAGPYIGNGFDTTSNQWHYFVNGMSMTVVYDVSIDPYEASGNYNIYFPLSDWSMARTTQDSLPNMNDYSRQDTYDTTYKDSFIPNVTRALISPGTTATVYLIGGSVYNNYAAMCKMQLSAQGLIDNVSTTYTKMNNNGLPLYSTQNRTLIDGIISYDFPNSIDKMVVLVGGKDKMQISDSTNLGVFYSTNAGANFTQSTCVDSNTEYHYKRAYVDGLFSKQFNLANDPSDITKKYLYLENGGFFKSTNSGATWAFISNIFDTSYYKDEGCLKVIDNNGTKQLFLAVKNMGLYLSTNEGANWNEYGLWTDATQVDAVGDQIVVFGKSGLLDYPMLYYKYDDNIGWESISNSTLYTPLVRSLRFDIHDNNIVYICTGGQGVFTYKIDEKRIINNNNIVQNDELIQNYPNPFNPITKIKYKIGVEGKVMLKVYDILGKEVSVLVNNILKPGNYDVNFDGSRLASGVYYYKFTTSNNSIVKKMLLIK